ncbi:MAG: hydantoinase B/oxoprolinase family protein [Chloroflexi bacterium]|nr:hydantoinase B/oxoprolinase family protein [Chloroflexota bacterium]
MEYLLIHRKCEFCGNMLFSQDNYLEEAKADKTYYYCDNACQTLYEKNASLEEAIPYLGKWLQHESLEPSPNVDPVTLEVILGGMISACVEMGKTMERTAHSPIFFEAVDFSTALFDGNMDRMAQFGLPSQVGAMQYGVVGAVKHIGVENLRPGDVLLHNDSYRGTPHPPEFCMVKPMFYDGKVIGYAANIAHHTDVGGKSPGSMPGDASEIYQEGVIIPPVKLFREGKEVDEVWQIILANVRAPRLSYGDFMAMYGSLVTAESRISELIQRYGVEEFLFYAKEIQKYSERRMRAEIKQIPNGIYSGTCMIDDDGIVDRSYAINVDVMVLDEDIILDYRRTDEQGRGPINAPYCVCVGGSVNAVFNLVDHTIPHNQGLFRPLHWINPPGRVTNCNYPAPLNGGNTETHNRLAEAVLDAFGKAVPERVAAAEAATCALISGGGTDPRTGEPFSFVIWEPSGKGGRKHLDGNTAIMTWVGPVAKNYTTEVLEATCPWRIVSYELREGSGGSGEHRGGLGLERVYEVQTPHLVFSGHANRFKFPPEGRFGGRPGMGMEFQIVKNGQTYGPLEVSNSIVSPTKFSGVILGEGDRIIVRDPGGGGYGDPVNRAGESVIEDLKNGHITMAQAVEDYGLSQAEAEEIVREYHWTGHTE